MSMTTLGPAEIGRRLYRSTKVHEAIPSPAHVTAEHMRRYWTDGFIAVDNVFAPDEVRSYVDGLLHLIRGDNPAYAGVQLEEATEAGLDASAIPPDDREPYVRKLMRFVDFDARLKSACEHPVLTGICRRLLGEGIELTQDMALLKPPKIGREKPWHQDNAYFNYAPLDGVIGTWTALDAATPENGCMHVIPGSHLKGPQPHFHDRDCQLPDEAIDVDQDVVVPLKPGGVLFFHGLLFHGTPPNQSSDKRRALQYHYRARSCLRITDDEHASLFADDQGYAGCRAWAMKLPPRRVSDRQF
jgi:phytanoyl-CoA hydroxylase